METYSIVAYIGPRWDRLVELVKYQNQSAEPGDEYSQTVRREFAQHITEIAKLSTEIRDAFLIHKLWKEEDEENDKEPA